MVNLQIRLRTTSAFETLVFIQSYLLSCVQGFAFLHNKPDNQHYHIYLFGIDTKPDSVRKTVGRYMPDKTTYSVATTAGGSKRLPLDPRIAYQYAKAPDSNPTLVWSRGFDEATLERFELSANAFYEQCEKNLKQKNQVLSEILVINNEKIKQDRTWERLCNDMIENPNKYKGRTLPQIKSMIAVEYLRQLKAVPRPSDLHRYAVSIYYISLHGLHTSEDKKISDEALVMEYA